MFEAQVIGLRPLVGSDVDLLTRLANDPLIRQMVVGWDWPVNPDAQSDWLQSTYRARSSYRFAIYDVATDESIGVTGLWDVDWHDRCAMSGIKLDVARAPKGAGTQAVLLANAWAFYDLGLHRLYSSILDFNAASLHLYVRKCGWRIEGKQREAVWRGGQWHDLYQVAILRDDFLAHPLAEEYRTYIVAQQMVPVEPGDLQ